MKNIFVLCIFLNTGNYAFSQSRFGFTATAGSIITSQDKKYIYDLTGHFSGAPSSWIKIYFNSEKKILPGFLIGVNGLYDFPKWQIVYGLKYRRFINNRFVEYEVVKDGLKKGIYIGQLDVNITQLFVTMGAQFKICSLGKGPLELKLFWDKSISSSANDSRLIRSKSDTISAIPTGLPNLGYLYYGKRNYMNVEFTYTIKLSKKLSIAPSLGVSWGNPIDHWLPYAPYFFTSWRKNYDGFHRFYSSNIHVKYKF